LLPPEDNRENQPQISQISQMPGRKIGLAVSVRGISALVTKNRYEKQENEIDKVVTH